MNSNDLPMSDPQEQTPWDQIQERTRVVLDAYDVMSVYLPLVNAKQPDWHRDAAEVIRALRGVVLQERAAITEKTLNLRAVVARRDELTRQLADLTAAHAADHAALQRLQEEVDVLHAGLRAEAVAPCGHYARFTLMCVYEDGSEAPTCMQCDRDAAQDKLEQAEAAVQRLQQENERLQQALAQAQQALSGMLAQSDDPNATTGEFDTAAGRAYRVLARLQSSTPQELK